jgi:hypothetical protein
MTSCGLNSTNLKITNKMNKEQETSINTKNHNWLYTLLCTVFSLESFGRHLVGNRFPSILRYWRPRNLVLKGNKPIYKWLWWYFVPKHGA